MASDSTALASVAQVVGLVAVLLISGVLARRGMKVNYTRKINHFDGASMQVAFRAKWRANLAFLILMPLVLIGARLVHRRRRGGGTSQNEKSEV